MDALTKVREDLDSTIEQAEALTRSENFDPEDPGYKALKDQAERLERSYRSMAEWQTRKSESDKIGATLHKIEGQKKADLATRSNEPVLSYGEMFTRSEVFTNYPGRGTSSRFLMTRALPTGLAEWEPALPPPVRRDLTPAEKPLTILDLIPSIPVSGNSVETIVYAKVAGDAAIVPEKGTKPLLEFAPTVTPVTLQNIAAATQVTRALLEDAPAVRARLDTMLANEIRQKQEAEAAGVVAGATWPAVTGESLLGAIRVGIATVQTAGYSPNVVLLNPLDWAELDNVLLAGTMNGPVVNQSFFGLRPVAHASQTAGTATVLDSNSAVENYTRSGINGYITDSHGTTFLENVFTILFEARSKTVATRVDAGANCSVAPVLPLAAKK